MSEEWAAPDGQRSDNPTATGESTEGLIWVRSIVVLVVAGVWAFVVMKLVSLNGDVKELTDSFFDNPSAVQVSQVANETMVEQLLYLGIGLAVSMVGITLSQAARRD